MKVNTELLDKLVSIHHSDDLDIRWAIRSPLMEHLTPQEVNESWLECNSDGTVSILGFVNSVLVNLTDKVLVVDVDDDGKVSDPRIVDRWW